MSNPKHILDEDVLKKIATSHSKKSEEEEVVLTCSMIKKIYEEWKKEFLEGNSMDWYPKDITLEDVLDDDDYCENCANYFMKLYKRIKAERQKNGDITNTDQGRSNTQTKS